MIKIKPLQMPKELQVEEKCENYARFVLSPLERGFGITIGHSLRRILLSSIQGAAITAVRIDGVLHEFSTIPGVLEDVPQIILNLKKVRFRVIGGEMPKTATLSRKGKGEVKAGDIETPQGLTVVNPEQHIATLTEEGKIEMEIKVDVGRGYVPAEMLRDRKMPIGTIFLDANFSPVTRVRYRVEPARVGQRTDFDKLILEVWTDGSVFPEEAVNIAAKILKDHMDLFVTQEVFEEEEKVEYDEEIEKLRKMLAQPVDELELPTRAFKAIKANGINTVGDLVKYTPDKLLKLKNFGRKSLNELIKILEARGLHLGMDLSKIKEKGAEK